MFIASAPEQNRVISIRICRLSRNRDKTKQIHNVCVVQCVNRGVVVNLFELEAQQFVLKSLAAHLSLK